MIKTHKNFPSELLSKTEEELSSTIIDVQIPLQGMDSNVFFVKCKNNQKYAIKLGNGIENDIFAYKLLTKHKIDVPIPALISSFIFKQKPVLILEKINFPLLESISIKNMPQYIPSMIANLKKIHQIKSDKQNWKNYLLSKFNNQNSNLNWSQIATRTGLDKDIVTTSVDKILNKINNTEFINSNYSFLHTDFNQRNLFIDPNSDQITAIIDWGETTFGDQIYDFARIRMLIWHFNLGQEVLNNYYQLLALTPPQKNLEELYFLSRIIEYLAYYSENLNQFNLKRIRLHQNFLKKYKWQN